MIKISFMQDWNDKTGTHYTQRIRATETDTQKIKEFLQNDYKQAQQHKNKNIITNAEMHKICYQKSLAETDQTKTTRGTKYYLNLTQLQTVINYIYSRAISPTNHANIKRLKYCNTVLVLE